MKLRYIPLLLVFSLFSIIHTNAQEITSFPGLWTMEYYEDDREITKTELNALLKTNQESYDLWQQAKSKQTLGYAFFAAEVGFGTWTVLQLTDDEEIAAIPAAATIGSGIVAIIFLNSANKKRKEAILNYNRSLEKKVSFDLNLDSDGVGLAVRF